jgi:hypothetical protein
MASRVPPDVLAAINALSNSVAETVRCQLRVDAAVLPDEIFQQFADMPDKLARRLLVAAYPCDAILSVYDDRYSPSQERRLRRMRQC